MKKNLIIRRGTPKENDFIKFNKYLKIPNKAIKSFKHNYIDDILIIKLYDEKIITISNFTFDDFKHIEYFKIIGTNKELLGSLFKYNYVDFSELVKETKI